MPTVLGVEEAGRGPVIGPMVMCGVMVDEKDEQGGKKMWKHVKKGVPVRLEIGAREVESGKISLARRDKDVKDKQEIAKDELLGKIAEILDEIQVGLFNRAKAYRDERMKTAANVDEFKELFSGEETGFVTCFAADNDEYEDILKPFKVTPRCIPLADNEETGKCIFTGKESCKKIIFAKAY